MLSWLVLTSVNSNIQWTVKWLYSHLNKACLAKVKADPWESQWTTSCRTGLVWGPDRERRNPFFQAIHAEKWLTRVKSRPSCPTLFASLESLSQQYFSNLSTSSVNTKPSDSYTVTCTHTHCSGYTFTYTQLVYTQLLSLHTHLSSLMVARREVLTGHYHIWPLVQLNF